MARDHDSPMVAHTGGSKLDDRQDPLAADWHEVDWSSLEIADEPGGWLRNIGVQYRPMWDAKRRAISTFVVIPTESRNSGEALAAGRQAVLPDNTPATQLELDTFMLQQAARDLATTLKEGAPALVSVQIGFETLANAASRMEYMRHLPNLSEEARKHLILELVDLPDGIATSRLFELAGMIKRQCRAVIAQVPPGYQNFGVLRESGISVAGIEIPRRPPDETALIGRLQKFAESAAKANLNSYLHGTPSLSLTVAAMAAGFTYIDGDAVASPSDGLQLVRRFGLQDLYMQVLRGPR